MNYENQCVDALYSTYDQETPDLYAFDLMTTESPEKLGICSMLSNDSSGTASGLTEARSQDVACDRT